MKVSASKQVETPTTLKRMRVVRVHRKIPSLVGQKESQVLLVEHKVGGHGSNGGVLFGHQLYGVTIFLQGRERGGGLAIWRR